MKTRLFIYPFTFLSFLLFSCSTDDIETQTEESGNNVKEEISKVNENTHAQFKDSLNTNNIAEEGDPIIVIPPRKD